MLDHAKPEKKKGRQSSEDIEVPPIPKQTAGAVTGAAIGSVAGPTGAVVGGVIGALVGKAASDVRPVRKAVKRATAASKSALKRHPGKSPPISCAKRSGGGYPRKLQKKGDPRPQQQRASERYARRANR